MNAGIADTRRSGFSSDILRSNDTANALSPARERRSGRRVRNPRRALLLGVAVLLALRIGDAAAQQGEMLDERVTQQSIGETICRPGYAHMVAPPFDVLRAHKDRMLAERGIDPDDSTAFALDRRVPIVLGGSPDAPANLNLLPWAGPRGERRKARAAVMLKRCVCEGKLSLAQAQAAIVGNWSAVYGGFGQTSCDVSGLDVATGDDAVEGDRDDGQRGEVHAGAR
ncbi:hypothetical protein [Paraburkholderia antibiotica]|uniref:Uncharacterized protein n=1 Tax=Paraburkholderia antibiotica TaxID=2728839 RepID=A0A7Y0FGX4_9BURK|nr:hypothetical protein [Paraburkholderia antibiotica]NML35465.1 hypothetical protein [Paraburkholderia antibiotica]